MTEVILYPTDTVYGLGVNVFDAEALSVLFALKGRDTVQTVSWLVRDTGDIEKYAALPPAAQRLAAEFLPGPLTLVLKANDSVPKHLQVEDGTIAFRISSDPIAQQLIADYMQVHDAPLSCTSANVHGQPTLPTTDEILQQFGAKKNIVTKIIDDGPRVAQASTIVRVVEDVVEVIREGSIPAIKITN